MKFVAAACTIALAIGAGLFPVSAESIETWYSDGLYPWLQAGVTRASNLVPFALVDIALVGVAGLWLVATVVELRQLRRRTLATLGTIGGRTAVGAAVIYLAFLLLWGFNYRRVPLERKVRFDPHAISAAAAKDAAGIAVARVNALHDRAHATGWPSTGRVDADLAAAFRAAGRDLGVPPAIVPGRPKHTLLDLYFRPAAVDGATDPFFLETLLASNLLPFERPFVVAHEWSHLAGFADEAEANFMGWLTCTRAGEAAQYSGWLYLYGELMRNLSRGDHAEVAAGLAAGPREDLRAVAARLARDVSPQVSSAGWRVYDKYLKANRVEAGTASYGLMVRLVLGSELGRQAARATAVR